MKSLAKVLGQLVFRIFIFCTIILCVTLEASAQPAISGFKHLTVDQGLSQNSINCIFQDRTGFLWFGTQDGLNRFDGYEFNTFRNSKNIPESISNNYIWDIFEDRSGILWIATFGGGLNRLDPKTGQLTHYKRDIENPNSFPSNRLFSITEGKEGVLWIGSNEGLIRFDTQNETSQIFLAELTNSTTYQDNYIGIVKTDTQGNLWLRSKSGLTHFNTSNHQAKFYQKAPYTESFTLGEIYDIENHNEALWVCSDVGLFEINPELKTDRLLLSPEELPIDGQKPSFRKVLNLKNNECAIGTNIGFVLFDPKTSKKEVYVSYAADEKSLTHSYITALFQSTDGTLWIGTRNGLNCVDQLHPDFVHLRSVPGKNRLSSANVNSIIEENDSLVWIGTTDGLNLYNKRSNTFTVYTKDDVPPNGLTTNYILCMFKDSKGNKWFGTRGHGVFKIRDNGTFKLLQASNEDISKISVHFITEDNQGHLWLGTGGRGMWKYDPTDHSVKTYPSAKDGTGPHHSYIFSILIDSKENMWIGTPTGGLNLFDPKTERFLYFLNDPNNNYSLSNDILLSLYEDKNNTLWIGTNGRLNKLIPKIEEQMFEKLVATTNDSLFMSYGREAGFVNNVVYGILEDPNNNLWIPTNQGLAVFNPNEGRTIKIYDTSHGLQSNEFNQNGYHKGKTGTFYFGGVNGLNMVSPNKISPNAFVPPIVFTKLSIFNEEVPVTNEKSKSFVLKAPLSSLDELFLSWKHDVITLDFTALSYKSPEKNRYSYKMDGFDDKWSPPGKTRSATYTNLDPGTYTFRVRAANNDGVWNNEGASLQIHISSPPWASWYAYVLYLLLASSLIYLFVRYRIHKATREIRVQNEIEKARMQERELFRERSSRDFHDEAGTKITRIALITELVKQKAGKNHLVQEQLNQLSENLQDLNTGMRDFIWALDPSKDNLYDTLNRFTDFAANFCEIAGVRFSANTFPKDFESVQLNMAQRRHILMILKEALNNSIKHGSPLSVVFRAEVTDRQLQVSLRDDGKGFNGEVTGNGNGLKNMKARAKAIGSELVIDSKLDEGTNITLKVPITQTGE